MGQMLIDIMQRESSATIKAAPTPYQQSSPPSRQKIIEFDCRGLEFTEFKPEVYYLTIEMQNLEHVLISHDLGKLACNWS